VHAINSFHTRELHSTPIAAIDMEGVCGGIVDRVGNLVTGGRWSRMSCFSRANIVGAAAFSATTGAGYLAAATGVGAAATPVAQVAAPFVGLAASTAYYESCEGQKK
jgi:hypothetical protein